MRGKKLKWKNLRLSQCPNCEGSLPIILNISIDFRNVTINITNNGLPHQKRREIVGCSYCDYWLNEKSYIKIVKSIIEREMPIMKY